MILNIVYDMVMMLMDIKSSFCDIIKGVVNKAFDASSMVVDFVFFVFFVVLLIDVLFVYLLFVLFLLDVFFFVNFFCNVARSAFNVRIFVSARFIAFCFNVSVFFVVCFVFD